jgi:hypothetical protein
MTQIITIAVGRAGKIGQYEAPITRIVIDEEMP